MCSAASAKRSARSRSVSPGCIRVRIDEVAVGLGDPRRPHPDRARDLEQPVLRQAGFEERLHPPRRLEVGLGEVALVGVGVGDAQGGGRPLQDVELEARDLGDLPRRVARPVAGQGTLDGQQGETGRLDRVAQLLERDAFALEALEQLEPGLARLALDALEQALGREVGHASATAPPRRGSPPPIEGAGHGIAGDGLHAAEE